MTSGNLEDELTNPKADRKVLIMLSGGPDSSTLAALAKNQSESGEGAALHAIYLRSGHPSDDQEIASADKIMREVGGTLDIVDIGDTLNALGMPRVLIHSQAAIMPFGNAYALSIAVAYAFRMGAQRLMIGLHKDDADESREYSRRFVDMVERLASFAREDAPTIETPFIEMTKSQVVKLGFELGVDYGATWSCIRAGDVHCGVCGACRARRRAFDEVGRGDPTSYATEPMAVASATHG